MSGGGPGEEHERAECIARAATAAAAKDQDQRAAHADGDPFAAVPWSAARYRFVSALDALAKVTVRRYPGGGERPDEERRHDELEIAKACAAVCLAVGWPDGARAGWAMASAEARDSRDRIAQLEDELAEYRKATASKTPAEAQETIVRLAGRIDAGQSALEQATSERDAALRSWEALRDQLAAAEAATEQARAERDAAERDRAALRTRVADLEADVASEVDELLKTVNAWQESTGCVCPEDAAKERAALRSRAADIEAEILAWRNATWSETPDGAEAAIEGRVKELERVIVAWRSATGCAMPEEASGRLQRMNATIATLRDMRPADEPDTLAAVRRDCAAERDAALCSWEALRDQLADAGRTWVERAEARLVALELEQAPTLARVAAVEAEVLTMRGRLDAIEAREARLDPELLGLRGRLDEVERRLGPKPDAFSEACREIAAERHSVECQWSEECGKTASQERTDLGGTTFRLCAEHVAEGTRLRYWRPTEQDARAAIREEVAALCDKAGWSGCAAGIRNGNAARIYLQPRPVATTEAARNAIAALDALDETEKPIAALWEQAAVLCERAGRPFAASELRRGRSVSDVLSMVRTAREWTREVRAAISALEKLDNASGSAHVAPGSIGPGTPEEQDRMRECPKNALHPLQAAGFRCSCGYEGVA